jgi:hypothetical protein
VGPFELSLCIDLAGKVASQFALLRSRTATELLARLVEETRAADARFTARWTGDQRDDGDLPQ